MSYFTIYQLDLDDTTPTIEQVVSRVVHLAEGSQPDTPGHQQMTRTWQGYLNGDTPIKWYDHENHLRQVSIEWPHVLLTLTGDGEETADSWVKYFRNGKMQSEEQPAWERPKFDPAKLR